jgi:hypothetical protein
VDRGTSRRTFLKRGLIGGALLAAGGVTYLATRASKLRKAPPDLAVLGEAEYSIFLAAAERILAIEPGAPTPEEVGVGRRADGVLALASEADQRDFVRLLRLFDNALTGLGTASGLAPFTASPGPEQDARLRAWERSRIAILRTGYQAVKRLATACYYSAPESWASIGYPGPPAILPAEAP